MTRVESPNLTTGGNESGGFIASLRNFFMRLFGMAGAPANAPSARATDIGDDEDEANGDFVLAPGGYRIRVPQASDVGHSVGDLLPSAREGLALLPPLPTVIIELLKEIQDPESTAASVAEVASSDPALAALLLRAANSATMGLSRTITSVGEAVSYLGFGTVKAMVVRLRLEDVLACKNEQAARDSEDLWVHSLIVSYASECLAKRIGGVDHGFVSTLGLLHDIGKLAVLAQLPKEAESIWMNSTIDPAECTLAREARVLGIDHAGLGANLAAKWKLPADLVQTIRNHHRPASAFGVGDPMPLRKSLHIMQIANQLAKYCYPHSDLMEIDQVSDEVFALLKLDPSLPKLLTGDVRQAISKAIFFATANTKRHAAAPRRFLRLIGKQEAKGLLAAPEQGELHVVQDDALAGALLGPGSREFRIAGDKLTDATGVAHARFIATATPSGIEKCVAAALKHQEQMELDCDARSAAGLTIKSLLANLLPLSAKEDMIEVAQLIEGRRLTFAVRAPGLATERRIGVNAPANAARRLAEVDFASLLNLGWFEKIAVSGDGSTIVFVRK